MFKIKIIYVFGYMKCLNCWTDEFIFPTPERKLYYVHQRQWAGGNYTRKSIKNSDWSSSLLLSFLLVFHKLHLWGATSYTNMSKHLREQKGVGQLQICGWSWNGDYDHWMMEWGVWTGNGILIHEAERKSGLWSPSTSYHLQVYYLIEIYKFLHVWVIHKVKYDEFYSAICNVLVIIWYLLLCGLCLVLS